MFYHDHAYGITRLNVYAGEAAAYLLNDPVEQGLVSSGVVAGPPNPSRPAGQDVRARRHASVLHARRIVRLAARRAGSDLGRREVRRPRQPLVPARLHAEPESVRSERRQHDGPLGLRPVVLAALHGAAVRPGRRTRTTTRPTHRGSRRRSRARRTSPACRKHSWTRRWSTAPRIRSSTCSPRAYRLRILNAANDRFLNLSFFVADPATTTADGRTNTEVKMVPFDSSFAAGFPASWGTQDARGGGVPDPRPAARR